MNIYTKAHTLIGSPTELSAYNSKHQAILITSSTVFQHEVYWSCEKIKLASRFEGLYASFIEATQQ